MLIDLHTHSTASDGQYTPAELVNKALEAGIELFSITDHDTVGGLEEGGLTAEKAGLSFIPGIEISTQDTEEIHILGYGFDRKAPELLKACEVWKKARTERGEVIRNYLSGKGIETDLAEIRAYVGEGNLGRPHFARYLLEKGIVSSRKEAFDRYLDTPEFREATDRKKPPCEEAIRLIHTAGGKAVLAHPGIYRMNDEALKGLVDRLAQVGLDGIECFYSRHTKAQTKRYLDLVTRFGLKTSCGSDFHGEKVKADVTLGMVLDEGYAEWLITV